MNAQGIDRIIAGSINSAFATWDMAVPSAAGATVRWELIDEDGRVFNSGNADTVVASLSDIKPGTYIIRADATIDVPGNIPTNVLGTQYQIKWVLLLNGAQHYVFDTFRVTPQYDDREGVVDTVELVNEELQLAVRINEESLEDISVAVYRGNTAIFNEQVVSPDSERTYDGYVYLTRWFATAESGAYASLEPLSVIWRYKKTAFDGPYSMQQGQLYIINPSLLNAIRYLEQMINAGYGNMGLQPTTPLDHYTLVNYLRQGMDDFNAYYRPTNFTMTNAKGPIRAFWLHFASVAACRAQSLAEGMRAFNFSGQSISLDVDRTQYWDNMASNTMSVIDSQFKMFKDNLNKRGIFGGDGSSTANVPGSIGTIGVRLSPLTPLRGGGIYPQGFGIYS